MTVQLQVAVLDTLAEAAGQAAAVLALQLRAAIELRGRAVIAFSGGRTPHAMFASLALRSLPWVRVEVLQVDERLGPEVGDPDRNLTALRELLIGPAGIPHDNVHPWPVTSDDVATASSARFARLTGGRPLDVVHLGVGADGHTASIFPDDGEPAGDVVVTTEHAGFRRVGLALPVLQAARSRVLLVAGADKAAAVQHLRDGDPRVPVGRLPHAQTFVLLDRAAAGEDGPGGAPAVG